MEYLSDKVASITGEALSEVRRKWADDKQPDDATNPSSGIRMQRTPIAGQPRSIVPLAAGGKPNHSSPLAGGILFGGDLHSSRQSPFPAPPPIGFRTDLLVSQTGQLAPGQIFQSGQPAATPVGPPVARVDASSESLYEGDTWSRLWFQRIMILCLLRLLLFIGKVYEDFQATKVYNMTGQRGHFLIAATTLFMPTIVFTIYRVSRYLQLALPPLRANKQLPLDGDRTHRQDASVTAPSSNAAVATRKAPANDDDAQLRRALMSSPDQSGGMATPVGGEDDGLVTARQTPTNMEEFHDSKSQQGSTIGIAEMTGVPPRPPPRRSNGEPQVSRDRQQPKLESINVDKMGDLPDRETVRVVVGASEQLLHGVLFIFWQLKRQVDVMGYLVERACLWRRPAEYEKEELNRMNCHRDGLEWFQDFYAAFLAILAQVYTLGLNWASTEKGQVQHMSASQLNAATSGLSSSEVAGSGSDNSVSQSARAVSNILGAQTIAGNYLLGKDVLLISELIVSSAVVLSLLVCVRRRDDGPLTLFLSMIGWGSLFAARIIIIALAFVHIGYVIMLPLVAFHAICITAWIYSIALDSHNGRASEMVDEAKWDEEVALEQHRQQETIELADANLGKGQQQPASEQQVHQAAAQADTPAVSKITASWSTMEHLVLVVQVLILFAIPSLFYWPIMFNLKLHQRHFKYLVLILIENFLLIPAIWFAISATATPGQLYLLGAVAAFSVVGFIFVSLYVACKPSLTEYFARADELFNEADKSGIYYEFCSRVFRMPDLSKGAFRRLMNQTEEIVEEVAGVDS